MVSIDDNNGDYDYDDRDKANPWGSVPGGVIGIMNITDAFNKAMNDINRYVAGWCQCWWWRQIIF